MNKRVKAGNILNEPNNFSINTTVNKLSQFLMNSYQIHNSISNTINSTYSIFTKIKFDIYTLNESILKEDKDLNSKIYTTVVIINSICNEFRENKTNCELEKYLDLTIKNKNNLRRNNENIEEINKAILPICIIKHSDINIILSISCPETLSEDLKNNIISAFQSIKPNLSKENFNINNISGLVINNTDNNSMDINLFDKRCNNENKNQKCEVIRNIIADKKRNLIRSYKKSNYELIDDKNKYYNSFNYSYEDITNNNIEDYFKYNLHIILELIKPLLKEKEYKILNISNNIQKNESNLYKSKRNLDNDNINKYLGIKEESFFSQSLFGVNFELNLKNDFGLEKLRSTKTTSNFIQGEKFELLSNNEIFNDINETLNEFIVLTNAGNKMSNSLYIKLNESLTNLKNIINMNISDLNNLLAYKDLSSAFDSSLAIEYLKEMPYSIISASQNLYSNIFKLNNSIEVSINSIKNKLKENIESFIINSHKLLDNIVNNITELSDALNSNKSKIIEISTYYLNYENSQYLNITQKAKLIMEKYYINEKSIIDSLLNSLFNDFSNKFLESLKLYQSLLDNLVNKLKNKSLYINKCTNKDIKDVINNLSNTKILINTIITNIPFILKNKINIKENEYFESEEEINRNKNLYEKIYNKAFNISYTLDNNLLIDTTFNKIIEDFQNQFINLLNNIEKSKKEKFPLKNNMVLDSFYILDLFDEMDNYFNNEKVNILNYIRKENDDYLEQNKKQIDSYIKNNKLFLDQKINNIDDELSEINLYNLDAKFNEMITNTINTINNIIQYNNNLAVQYLTNVKNAGPSHCTQLFIDKANIFFNSFSQIKNFIQFNLKNNFSNKYKNVLILIKGYLENIKSNSLIKKYSTQLTFTDYHLRTIDNIIKRFDKYLSNELLEKNYLGKIDNFVQTILANITQIETNLQNLYNAVKSLTYSSDNNYDYYKHRRECWEYCDTKIFGHCFDWDTECADYYDGYTATGSNNHLSLKSINFDECSKNFDSSFNDINSKVSNNKLQYENNVKSYDNNFNSLITNKLNNTKAYLKEISEKINYFINDEISKNITILSYNYFKKEINNKLIYELNYILSHCKKIYNDFIDNINLNIDQFKYSIQEYGILGEQLYNIYYQNISNDYSNSIIEQMKNDFNYTLKYYHNMILSKVNKTYYYILNKMPINEELFNDILKIRINEIQESYNNFKNKINISKNKYLNIKSQLNIIKVNESDFFNIHYNIKENNEYSKSQLLLKYEELLKSINNVKKENIDESIISKSYVQILQNEKQIKEIYQPINKDTFIDLQSDIFKDLIKSLLQIDKNELIKNIKNNIIKSNEIIDEKFEIEKEKYLNILENVIYKQFYTKEDLEKKIDDIYINGLKDLDSNSKNKVYEYLIEILNKIKFHISNEISRLSNSATSYSNNYNIIENRLNNLKISIFNLFNSTILSIANDFYTKLMAKFYTNYIEKNLNEYQNYLKNEKFKEYKFLNITINLKNIVNEGAQLFIKEYKDLAIKHIDYLNQKNIQKLDKLFSFSNISNTINKEINNRKLLEVLEKVAIYNSGDYGISDYDLSKEILVDINSFISEKINQSQQIINKMKGNNYNIDENWVKPNFTKVKDEDFLYINNSFNNFTEKIFKKEEINFNKVTQTNINNNYKFLIENIIVSFGKDFFDKIIKYNEVQKIKTLFSNLKYSLTEVINYNIQLFSKYNSISIPEDLKNKIISLNNIDSLIESLKSKEISEVEKKLNKLFSETKDYITDTYIYFIKVEPLIELELDDEIKIILDKLLDDNREIFEDEYNNIININIKNWFIEEYNKVLNEESNNMNNFIKYNKNLIKTKLDSFNILKTDYILLDIENKLNNTNKSINDYNSYFDSFKIQEEISELLNNYCKDTILPYYKEIKLIIDNSTKDIVAQNLDKNVKNIKNNFVINNFVAKSNNITNNLKNSNFNNINNYLNNSYGTISSVYLNNLEKEIIYYLNLRRLDNLNNNEIINQKINENINLAKTLKLIKGLLKEFNEFFKNLNYFSDFDNKIKKYINEINEKYIDLQNNINSTNYEENIKQKLFNNLDELKNFILDYYIQANFSYYQSKENITNSINQMNNLLEKCINITYKEINKKYIKLKDNFKPVNFQKIEKKSIELEEKEEVDGTIYKIEANIDEYLIENQISFDISLNESDGDILTPIILGKLINKNHPKKMVIDFYTNNGQSCEIKGRKMTINFNNISLISDMVFDNGLNNIRINNIIDFDEYNIKSEKYTVKEKKIQFVLAGIEFVFPSICKTTLDGESEVKVVNEVKNNTFDIFWY